MAAPNAQQSEIRYLNPVTVDVRKKKYCRFKKAGIKYVDYKDPEFLKKFLNEQGKILPRRLTGTSQKFQKKVAQAVKRARHLAILPFVQRKYCTRGQLASGIQAGGQKAQTGHTGSYIQDGQGLSVRSSQMDWHTLRLRRTLAQRH